MLVSLARRLRDASRAFALAALLVQFVAIDARAQFTRFQNYNDEQGLGDLTVTALAQDRDGYILLGTQGGLYRFDGSSMTPYDSVVGLPPSPWIGQLTIDDAGRLWAMTTDGIFVRGAGNFRKADTGKAVFDPSFAHLVAARGSDVYLLSDRRLLHATISGDDVGSFTPAFDERTLALVPDLRRARFVATGAKDEFLIGCGTALCRLVDGKIAVLGPGDGLPADEWEMALRTPDGTLWLRSLRHLARQQPHRSSFEVFDVPGQHSSFLGGHPEQLGLIPDPAGGVLTQGDQGILDFDGRAWRSLAHHEAGLPASAVEALLLDREGSLWAGSSGYGAFRSLGLGEWEHWTTEDGLPDNNIWSIGRSPDDRLWVSTASGTAPLGDASAPVPGLNYVIATSRRGRLWFAPLGAPLTRLDRSSGTTERFPSIGPVLTAAVDAGNRLWMCTRRDLYLVGDADAPASEIRPKLALSHERMNLVRDHSGAVWALSRDGVWRDDGSGSFRLVIPASLLRGQPIDAASSPAGDLWIATEQDGVLRFHFDGRRVEPLAPLQAPILSSDAILFLLRDHRGWMWVGTDRGLDVLDHGSWRRFDSSEGPISNDLDEWSAAEDADGSMWFGTSHGLSHLIAPVRLPQATRLHPEITQVSLGDRVLPTTRSVSVGWSSAPLVVHFADLDYARGRVSFRYRLRGLDAGWSRTTAHEVRYAHLPAGKLTFQLVAVDELHGSISAPVGFVVDIGEPWWRRWWFYAFCTMATASVLFAAWRARVRLLLQHQRHLEAVVNTRTAEIEQARRELQEKSRHEQERLAGEQRRLEEMVRVRTHEIEQARRELERMAMSDVLTGLANRRAIMDVLENAVAEALASGAPLAILLCDLDDFKMINDGFGHLAGDAVLACFGDRLSAALSPPESAGRYGGEEFLIILPGTRQVVRRRVAAISSGLTDDPFSFGGADRTVTMSGGLAFLRPGDTAVTLVGRADAALYEAKSGGRDRIEEEGVQNTPVSDGQSAELAHEM